VEIGSDADPLRRGEGRRHLSPRTLSVEIRRHAPPPTRSATTSDPSTTSRRPTSGRARARWSG
jgi:hypothetical protein